MVKYIFSLLLGAFVLTTSAQEYTSSSIFAHNDYVHPIPFFSSYFEQVGFIEADIFLQKNNLMVAHTISEIDEDKTLEELYLKPLQKKIIQNKGFVYPSHEKSLTLMIDLKTEGVPTLNILIKKLKKYPQLISCPTLSIVISGSVPDPSQWKNYPSFIYFDGRPGISYSKEQLDRIQLISTNFKDHTQWNGKGVLIKTDREKITTLIQEVHTKGKRIRFWGAPDFDNAWMIFMGLKVDILGTDHVASLATYLKNLGNNTYQQDAPHSIYRPSFGNGKFTSTPKNIILMIGDGMGLTQLYSGYTANHGDLNIFMINDIGFSVTTAVDSYITDSAAGATAMATGQKTNNRYIGVDSLGRTLPSITEKLKDKGFRTAIISCGDITDATPASFYAHQPERSMNEAIAADFLISKNDILIGGGTHAFKIRKDKINLLTSLAHQGYTVSETANALDTIRSAKYVVLDNAGAMPMKQGRKDFLTKCIQKSIASFTTGNFPFFIMAEGAQIDHGGHNNNVEQVVRELLDFDQAVGEVMKFIDLDGETLLIVTADHETGGLSLLGGDISKGYVQGNFSTNDHTAVMVPVFAYGPGSENFRGVYQNTQIHFKILDLLIGK